MAEERPRRRIGRKIVPPTRLVLEGVGRALGAGVVVAVGPDHDLLAVRCHGGSYRSPRRGVSLATWSSEAPLVARAEDVPSLGHHLHGCYHPVVAGGPDHDGVAVDRHGDAEVVFLAASSAVQLGHLDVRGAAVGRAEDVGRARVGAGVVVAPAPTTTVLPSIATDLPKWSSDAASEAVSLATWTYVAPPSVVRKT